MKIIASSRLFILSAKNNPWWKELRLPLEEYVDTVVTLAWLINYVYVRQVLRNKQRGDRLLPNSHTRYSSSTVETVAGSGMELNFVFQPSKSSSLKRKFILEFRFERQKEKRKKGSKRVKWSLESFERFQGEIFYFERIFFEFERIEEEIEFHVQDFSSFLPSFHINIYCSSTGFYSTKDRIIFLLNFAKKKKEVVEMEGMNIEEIKICTLRGINDPPPESRWNVSFHRCCSTPPSPETAQTNFPNDRDPTISFPRLLKMKYSKYSKTSRKDSIIFFFFLSLDRNLYSLRLNSFFQFFQEEKRKEERF